MPKLGVGQADAQLPGFAQQRREDHLESYRLMWFVLQVARMLPDVALTGTSLGVVALPMPDTDQQQNNRQGAQEAIVRVGDPAAPASVGMLALEQPAEQIGIRQGAVGVDQPRDPTGIVIRRLDGLRGLHPEDGLCSVIQVSGKLRVTPYLRDRAPRIGFAPTCGRQGHHSSSSGKSAGLVWSHHLIARHYRLYRALRQPLSSAIISWLCIH